MMSCTSPPEEKLPPFDAMTGSDVVVRDERPERVAKLGVGVERQRVLPLGPGQRDDGDAAVEAPVEVPGANRHVHTVTAVVSERDASRYS